MLDFPLAEADRVYQRSFPTGFNRKGINPYVARVTEI